MKNPEFMHIKYKCFPNVVRKQYSLDRFVTPLVISTSKSKKAYTDSSKLHSLRTSTSCYEIELGVVKSLRVPRIYHVYLAIVQN